MKKFLAFLLSFILVLEISAQGFDKNKLVFGGNIGGGVGDDSWTLGVIPKVGYRLNNKFTIGAGLGYIYGHTDTERWYLVDQYEFESHRYTESKNAITLNTFVHFYPWKKLIFSIQPELSYIWYRGRGVAPVGENNSPILMKYSKNVFAPAIIIGGGVVFKPVIVQLNYEIIHSDYSLYNKNLFLSLGLTF